VIATLYPATAPQDQQTVALVTTLRDSLIPQARAGTGLVVHVGGQTATAIDFAHVLGSKLPLFVAVVVTGPVDAFLPVVLFSVLFGLSMDYEVYTVGRMHEQWRRLQRDGGVVASLNHRAVTAGQAQSTRIVVAAAGVMILVFGSFLPGGHHLLQEFGFGLGFAVLVDALLIRSLLLPAVMHLIGPANWFLPARLARVLPRLDVEADGPGEAGETEAAVPASHEAASPPSTR
jgi:RND superfamily putative drug exporter